MARLIALLACVGFLACGSRADDVRPIVYRVEIMTPGGPLAFIMHSDARRDGTLRGGTPLMVIINASERVETEHVVTEWTTFPPAAQSRLDRIVRRSRRVSAVSFPEHGSELTWTAWYGLEIGRHLGQPATGVWRVRRAGEVVELPVLVTELRDAVPVNDAQRFAPLPPEALLPDAPTGDFAGRWTVRFGSGNETATGTVETGAHDTVTLTIDGTAGGRLLSGRIDGPYLRASRFDGSEAVLLHATMQADGTISGGLWKGDWEHHAWTAVRETEDRVHEQRR